RDVIRLGDRGLEAGLAVGRVVHGEARFPQSAPDELGDRRVVFDQQGAHEDDVSNLRPRPATSVPAQTGRRSLSALASPSAPPGGTEPAMTRRDRARPPRAAGNMD